MSENKIAIYKTYSQNRACIDIRAKFLDQDIVIDSLLYSQEGESCSIVRAFQAAAEDVFILPDRDGLAQVLVNNDRSGPQSLLKGEDLAKKVEATLKKMACLPA